LVEIIGITIHDTILTALISGLIGFVPTYLGAILKYRKDLEMEFDKSLREERIKAYTPLWKCLKILSKHPSRNVEYKELVNLLKQLHIWYFDLGMFLSESSRNNLFDLKECIITCLSVVMDPRYIPDLLDDEKNLLDDEKNLLCDEHELQYNSDEVTNLVKKAHKLRNSLANDMGTRRQNKIVAGKNLLTRQKQIE
jgi:hypothetical protein